MKFLSQIIENYVYQLLIKCQSEKLLHVVGVKIISDALNHLTKSIWRSQHLKTQNWKWPVLDIYILSNTVNKSQWSFRNLQLTQNVSLIISTMQKDPPKWAHNPSLMSLPFSNLLIYTDFHRERESSLKIKYWKGQKVFLISLNVESKLEET